MADIVHHRALSLPAASRPAPAPVTTTTMPPFGSLRCWPRDKFRPRRQRLRRHGEMAAHEPAARHLRRRPLPNCRAVYPTEILARGRWPLAGASRHQRRACRARRGPGAAPHCEPSIMHCSVFTVRPLRQALDALGTPAAGGREAPANGTGLEPGFQSDTLLGSWVGAGDVGDEQPAHGQPFLHVGEVVGDEDGTCLSASSVRSRGGHSRGRDRRWSRREAAGNDMARWWTMSAM